MKSLLRTQKRGDYKRNWGLVFKHSEQRLQPTKTFSQWQQLITKNNKVKVGRRTVNNLQAARTLPKHKNTHKVLNKDITNAFSWNP